MLQLAKSCSLLEGIEAERRRSERVAEAEAEADDGKAKKTTPINLTSGGGGGGQFQSFLRILVFLPTRRSWRLFTL